MTGGPDPEREFWRWPESRWTSPDVEWRDGEVVAAGVDVGSVSSQAVVLVDGDLYCHASRRTGASSPDSARGVMSWALEGTGLELADIEYVVGTGYGRANVPFAQKTATEIACHARGANFMYGPEVRTVLDMGGQDCKVIRCDHRGKVVEHLVNDKCAAGTGRGMEVFADLVSVPIEDVGEMSLRVEEEPDPISSTCVVFAKTEAIGLLRDGRPREQVLAAYCGAMAHRVVELLDRLGVEPDFAITGGIAKNPGIVRRIERELDVEALEPRHDTQLAGAVGAALLAKTRVERARRRSR